MTYDSKLYQYNPNVDWSANKSLLKYKDIPFHQILQDDTISRESKGNIRELQLRENTNPYIEYKVMLDTKLRKRFFIETSIATEREGIYRDSGFSTSEAEYWRIEGYNYEDQWTVWVFTKEDIKTMIGMEKVEVIQTNEKALPVRSKTSTGYRIQYTKGYSIPYTVLRDFEDQRRGKKKYKYINNPKMKEKRN